MLTLLLSIPTISFASGTTWINVKSNIDFSQLNYPANFSFGENNVVQLKDGRVMVIGTKSSYIYNYQTEKWTAAAPVNQKGDIYAPVLLQDGRVMVFPETEIKDNSSIKKAEIYNPTTNKWSLTSELNTQRHATVNSVLMKDGSVMVAGGSYGEGNDVEIYYPATDTWTKATNMNHKANNEVTLLSLKDGRILATGGSVLMKGDGTLYNSEYATALEMYDPSKNQWKVHSISQDFNNSSKLMELENGLILFIGDYRTGIYNLKEDQFKTLTETGFFATAGIELPNDRVLISGADADMNKGKAYIYSVEHWEMNEVSIPSIRPLLYVLPNDRILALGTAKRVNENGLQWIWDKLYISSLPGLFIDVPNGYWAEDEIQYLVGLNIINGIGNGNFSPLSPVTRAEGAAMLARSLKLNVSNRPDPGFKDLPKTHWAYKEIAALVDEGIYPRDPYFQPGTPLKREEMARLLVNAFQLKGETNQQFTDVSKNDSAYPYINKLAANQITTGYPDGSFGPKNTLTRTEFSVFVARALDKRFR